MQELIQQLSQYTTITFYKRIEDLHLTFYPSRNVGAFYTTDNDLIYVCTKQADMVSHYLYHEVGHLLYRYGLLTESDVPNKYKDQVCKTWLNHYSIEQQPEELLVDSFAYWSDSDCPAFTTFFELALTRLTKAKDNLRYLFTETEKCLGWRIDEDDLYYLTLLNLKYRIRRTNQKVYSNVWSSEKATTYLLSIPAKLAEFVRPLY